MHALFFNDKIDLCFDVPYLVWFNLAEVQYRFILRKCAEKLVVVPTFLRVS